MANKKNSENLQQGKKRFLHLDYYRAIIILLMIQGHSLRALLLKDYHYSSWFRIHEFIHSIVAPGFLFLSGYLFFHTIKNKVSKDFLIKGYHYIGIIFIGYFLHLPFFSLRKIIELWGTGIENKFLNMDILQTIGYSLIISLLAWVLLRKIFILLTFLLISFNLFHAYFHIDPGNFFFSFFFDKNLSQFPLFPWSLFFFLGIFASKYLKKFNIYILLISIVLIFFPFYSAFRLEHIFSDIGKVFFLLSLTHLIPVLNITPIKKFLIASRESLFLYVSHIMIVYGSVLIIGLSYFFKESLNMFQYFLVFASLVLLLYPISYYLNNLKSDNRLLFNKIKYSIYTLLFIIFVLRKW
ncbi:MAG: heparan-alpha-glucosaminide N-acetyltransferase domain-containing protein [Acidobacteriota bacterium]